MASQRREHVVHPVDLRAVGAGQARRRLPLDGQLLRAARSESFCAASRSASPVEPRGAGLAGGVGDLLAQLVVHAAQLLDRGAHVAHGASMSSGRIFCSERETR